MKKLNYVFMISAIVFALGGMLLAMYLGKSWVWQFSTACWAYIAYINQKHIDRNTAGLKEMSDEINDYLKNKK